MDWDKIKERAQPLNAGELTQIVKELSEHVKVLRETVENLAEESSLHSDVTTSQRDRIEDLETRAEGNLVRIYELEDRVASQEMRIETLEAQVRELRARA